MDTTSTQSTALVATSTPQSELETGRARIQPGWPVPLVSNVVANCELGCILNLHHISNTAWNVSWNRKRFHGLVMRIREPRTTALMFGSGRMVIVGAKSESDSRLAGRKFARIIRKMGYQVSFDNFKIQNIVASCDVGFPIRVEGIAAKYHHFAILERELFPGLVYHLINPKVTILIFSGGKIVLTGAKTRDQMYEAFSLIYPICMEFRKY
ncbi:transcription factor TFIID-domain-containing protein [Rhypophila decipiens]|uniref:Transcription factor TFIID-domain-containing protein n=1 Tax=Rhypophila decipiens TaxID=261697 RepID=A0AAN7B1R8_9PEZI|nr:transcription factor TFIID-domain-containing protein [Rhypophila decipiens]